VDFFEADGFVDFRAGAFVGGVFLAAVFFFVDLLAADFFERAGAIGHSIWSI